MKKCSSCKLEKVEANFNKNKHTKDGLQTTCRECGSKNSKIYYSQKTTQHKADTSSRRKKKRREVRIKLDEIKAKYGCRTCDEKDSVCLEFHHLDATTKEFEIGNAARYEWAWSKIVSEINKCVCLCANCHRKLHAGKFCVTSQMLCNE